MRRSRWAVGVVAVALVALAAGSWLVLGGGVKQAVAERKVRDVAVGSWLCTVTYDGAVEWKQVVGITSDGRLAFGNRTRLVEVGTWTIDGLQVELRMPLQFSGQTIPVRLTYTADADPPSRVEVLDSSTGDTGRFDVDLSDDRLTASQTLTDRDGSAHRKQIRCTKTSDDEPQISPPR